MITIRMNASTNEVAVNGQTFDRSTMSRDEKVLVRRMIIDWRFPKAQQQQGKARRRRAA